MSDVLVLTKCPKCGAEHSFIEATLKPGEESCIRMPVRLVSGSVNPEYDYIQVDTDVITQQAYMYFKCASCGGVITDDTDVLMDMLKRGEVQAV